MLKGEGQTVAVMTSAMIGYSESYLRNTAQPGTIGLPDAGSRSLEKEAPAMLPARPPRAAGSTTDPSPCKQHCQLQSSSHQQQASAQGVKMELCVFEMQKAMRLCRNHQMNTKAQQETHTKSIARVYRTQHEAGQCRP